MAACRRRLSFVLLLVVALVLFYNPVYQSFFHNVWSALDADDSALMEKCIKDGFPLDTAHLFTRETLLLRAVRRQRWKCYQLLLESGANPNTQCGKLPVVVQYAVINADPRWLEHALKHGADPDLVNQSSVGQWLSPAIFWAVSAHREHSIRLLLDAGASPDAVDEVGNTFLVYAADFRMFSVVLRLIEMGVDWRQPSRNGGSLIDELKRHQIEFYGPSAKQEKSALMEVRKMVLDSGLCRYEELTPEANILIHEDVR